MLTIKEVLVRVGRFQLFVETLEVGSHVAILGRNGSGKTTLLKTVAGFIKPLKGEIILDGKNVTDLPPGRRGLGYIPQEPVRLPQTPHEALNYFAKKFDHDYKALLEELGLNHIVEKRHLSVGENQLLLLTIVLLRQPSVLLLDEPSSSLDYINRLSFWKVLRMLRKPTLLVTHDPLEAVYIADKLYIIEDGCVQGPYPNTLKDAGEEALKTFNLYEKLVGDKMLV